MTRRALLKILGPAPQALMACFMAGFLIGVITFSILNKSRHEPPIAMRPRTAEMLFEDRNGAPFLKRISVADGWRMYDVNSRIWMDSRSGQYYGTIQFTMDLTPIEGEAKTNLAYLDEVTTILKLQ